MDITSFLELQKFTPEDAAHIGRAFIKETFPKGHQLLGMDNLSKKVYFVESGLLRSYYLKETKDITHLFFAENAVYMPIESIFYNKPSPYGLEVLEKCTVYSLRYPEIEKYFDKYPPLEKMGRTLLVDALHSVSERLYIMQFQSAKDRYQSMLHNYPNILLRAPLGHIASYLGITQQTLSAIRAGK